MSHATEALAHSIGRVDAADDECSYSVGPPSSDGWCALGGLLGDPEAVDALVAIVVAGEAGGHRDVAGSYLASWLAGPVVHVLATVWRTEGRVLQLDLDQVWVRFHEDGWVDGLALTDAGLVVGADDPAADVDGVEVVADPVERCELVAGEIRSAATLIFDAIRPRVPYGRSGMWGSLPDGLVGSALWAEQGQVGGDPDRAWVDVDSVLDVLARQVPDLRARPRRQLIPWSGGVRHQSVRGTCCLYYKTCTDPDPSGDGYCSSCPHRPDGSRAERIVRWLEDQPA